MIRQEIDALLRQDFSSFVERVFYELNQSAAYHPNWHIDAIASKLNDVRLGKTRRLIINLPPRNLKSICTSVAFPAWLLGHDPSCNIICVSYGQDLATKLALDTRLTMSSAWYRSVFHTRLSANRSAAADFTTIQGGGRMATSVGGVLTGRGADILIIDDPTKPDEALSDTQRRNANEWYDHTLYSRLNDKTTGAIIIVMQRLHLDDLVGHVLEQEPWEILSLPAIAPNDEVIRYERFGRQMETSRKEGDVLDVVREPLATLDAIRLALGEYHFSAQYLQSPVPLGGGFVKLDWMKRYSSYERPHQFDQIVQSWDTANKVSDLADCSVCTTWGVSNKKVYLLDVLRRRMEYPDLKRAVHAQAELWKPQTILIEDKASGTQLVQELRQEQRYQATGVKPEGEKVMRMLAQTAMIENGIVYFPEEAPWLPVYIQELTTFPKGKNDDQVDSTAQALAWIKKGFDEPAYLVFMRELLKQDAMATLSRR
ncbi:phage terminase large subunit [Rhodanobacter sp. L36]|uniref:phage terminase large subunit n=1 Tax=Rhodanobacter sp. L36 TaxID=1747221 RepID=UPI00131CA13E|nr:phage terminase large subunit [Rhodanobacter sp. L36]